MLVIHYLELRKGFSVITKVSELPQLTPPEDKTITSLYVGGVEGDITEKDLR